MSERDYYEHYADTSPEEFIRALAENPTERRRFQMTVEAVPPSTSSLLDVGCGNGIFLHLMREQKPHVRAVGLERSSTTTAAARRLFGVDIIEGTVEALPFSDESFDVVTASEVIEHLPFGVYEHALAEMERVARQTIIITVPFREKCQFATCPYCGCSFHPSYHMRSFDEQRLCQMFKHSDITALMKIHGVIPPLVLLDLFARGYRYLSGIRKKPGLPKYALCPQCGYGKTNQPDLTVQLSERTPATRMMDSMRRLLIIPRSPKARWALAMYQRSRSAKSDKNAKEQ